jgi:hypothetical protein
VASVGEEAAWFSRAASSNGDGGLVLDGETIQTQRSKADVWNGGGGARGCSRRLL